MDDRSQERVMSSREVASRIGIELRTLAKAIWSGNIAYPLRDPDGAFLWDPDDFTRAQRYFKRRRLEVIL